MGFHDDSILQLKWNEHGFQLLYHGAVLQGILVGASMGIPPLIDELYVLIVDCIQGVELAPLISFSRAEVSRTADFFFGSFLFLRDCQGNGGIYHL
jgi:hypothetical protein